MSATEDSYQQLFDDFGLSDDSFRNLFEDLCASDLKPIQVLMHRSWGVH
jgi:hypothetical protein